MVSQTKPVPMDPDMDMEEQELLDRVKRQYGDIWGVAQEEREQCEQDRRFCNISGAQWEDYLDDLFVNRPRLEINKVRPAVLRVLSEYENNKVSATFLSEDNPELAETCNDLYRAVEAESLTKEAYSVAFREMVTGGMGAWVLRNEYVDPTDPDDDRQKIIIDPIQEPDTKVFFDPDSSLQSKSDAAYCYILSFLSRDAYIREYDDDPSTWPTDLEYHGFDWSTPDGVYVAEYYELEKVKEKLVIFVKPDPLDPALGVSGESKEERYYQRELDEDDGYLEKEMERRGYVVDSTRDITANRVHKYIFSGASILEDCGYIPGDQIPVVPVYGFWEYVSNIERISGMVRGLKDMQRAKNTMASLNIEQNVTNSSDTPVVDGESVRDYLEEWQNRHIDRPAVLRLKRIEGSDGNLQTLGMLGEVRMSDVNRAFMEAQHRSDEDMREMSGERPDGLTDTRNVSTDTALLEQRRLDAHTQTFLNSMTKGIERSATIYLSMIRDVFIEEGRTVRGRGVQGDIRGIQLMLPKADADGEIVYDNDLSKAKFDVEASSGPSTVTKKAAVMRTLISLAPLAQYPENQNMNLLFDSIMLNIEQDGMNDIKEFIRRRQVSQGIIKPTEEDKERMQQEAQEPKEPDPNEQYLLAAAEKEKVEALRAEADIELKRMQIVKTESEALKILSEAEDIDVSRLQSLLDAFEPTPTGTAPGTPASASAPLPNPAPPLPNPLPNVRGI